MLKLIIIEDERLARENIIQCLSELTIPLEITQVLVNVQESIDYLTQNPEADLIFCDVQLPDGLSFSIFENTQTNIPVIFITAYDHYLLNAFESNGIDYLLKPTDKNDLEKALKKYQQLEKHFVKYNSALEIVQKFTVPKRRTRVIVKKGLENIPLLLSDVVLFYTENKIVYVVDRNGKKYLLDKNLSELEEELDDTYFFRANRQYIINIRYVKGFKSYEKVKLYVDLSIPELHHDIIISQETAPEFRKWIYEA